MVHRVTFWTVQSDEYTKAVPRHVWMNDAEVKDGVFIRDYRVEVSLEAIRAQLNEQTS